MTASQYTTNDAARGLVDLVMTRTAVADGFVREDNKIEWSLIAERWSMLSSGEQAMLILASELGDAPIEHTGMSGLCEVLQWCDDEYKVHLANVLTNLLLP